MHHAAPDAVRAKRPRRARALDGEELLATKIVRAPSKPGCTARSPGFLFALDRVLGTTRQAPRPECPAGGIGIRTRLRNAGLRVRIPGGVPEYAAEVLHHPRRHSVREYAVRSFTIRMWHDFVRAGRLQRATPRGRSSIARAPALQAGRRRLDSDRLHPLAVAQLASAPRSGRGDRRFESCRRDQHHLRSSTERERAATDREMRVRILPLLPRRR